MRGEVMNLYERDYEKPTKKELVAIKKQDEFLKKGISSPENVDPIESEDESIRNFVQHYRTKFPNNVIWPGQLNNIESEKESKSFEIVLDSSNNENDIQLYIKSNKKWFIPGSILKEYNFGHKENYLFPEMMLGSKYKVDYAICGRNSDGYHLLLIEFENANIPFINSDGNCESKSVNSGLGQINNWKSWMNNNRQTFLDESGFSKKGISIPISRIHYCLVVSRRSYMNDLSRERKNQLIYEGNNLNIINYDRICENIKQIDEGYCMRYN